MSRLWKTRKNKTWAGSWDDANKDDLKTEFPEGDQDYGSAVGWDPDRDLREERIAAARKRNPKAFAPRPQMLEVGEAQGWFSEAAPGDGPVKRLFGPFWRHDEIAVLFARTGVGKSVLALQIADTLARGAAIAPFDQAGTFIDEPQRVLFLDFELTRTQFTERYTEPHDTHGSTPPFELALNLFRAQFHWDGRVIDGYEDFTEMIFTDIRGWVESHMMNVLIIDNITFLTRGAATDSGMAFRVMESLRELRAHYGVSILLVAHTPKTDKPRPLTENDLQGSIDLAKLADSMFAMGTSRVAPDLRYLKHVKNRSAANEHDESNILLYRLGKWSSSTASFADATPGSFLGLAFDGFAHEYDHLALPYRPGTPRDRASNERKVQALADQGYNIRQIAKKIGLGHSTVHRYLGKALKKQNRYGDEDEHNQDTPKDSPPYEGGVAAAAADGVVP